MKNWYDVIYTGHVNGYHVDKEVHAAIFSYCQWTRDTLEEAMRNCRRLEPGVIGLSINSFRQVAEEPAAGIDKVIDLDSVLGI